jgi:ParB-like chromosome segregation protein Spo0J
MNDKIKLLADQLAEKINAIDDVDSKIDVLNEVRKTLHNVSPLKHHPVDCVFWEKSSNVEANEYNPNAVAPPEMALLRQSIVEDGYTMPIVAYRGETIKIVDGFHRRQTERNNPEVSASTFGRVPLTQIRTSQEGQGERMASTIRHNRARGSHNIELMSTIVAELVEMGKGDRWICQHLGMTADELLRMKQITGLAALFQNDSFSKSWEVEGHDDGTEVIEFENSGFDD